MDIEIGLPPESAASYNTWQKRILLHLEIAEIRISVFYVSPSDPSLNKYFHLK
jgi:hypothetical protein